MEHALKTWPQYYERVLSGEKTFEVRRNDRGFQKGDVLWLREYDMDASGFEPHRYTLRSHRRVVTYVLTGETIGIKDGFAVLGLGNAYDVQDSKAGGCDVERGAE